VRELYSIKANSDLYKGETSLDGQLAIISERLGLKSMPWLKTLEEKDEFLTQLEEIFYWKVYHEHHDY